MDLSAVEALVASRRSQLEAESESLTELERELAELAGGSVRPLLAAELRQIAKQRAAAEAARDNRAASVRAEADRLPPLQEAVAAAEAQREGELTELRPRLATEIAERRRLQGLPALKAEALAAEVESDLEPFWRDRCAETARELERARRALLSQRRLIESLRLDALTARVDALAARKAELEALVSRAADVPLLGFLDALTGESEAVLADVRTRRDAAQAQLDGFAADRERRRELAVAAVVEGGKPSSNVGAGSEDRAEIVRDGLAELDRQIADAERELLLRRADLEHVNRKIAEHVGELLKAAHGGALAAVEAWTLELRAKAPRVRDGASREARASGWAEPTLRELQGAAVAAEAEQEPVAGAAS